MAVGTSIGDLHGKVTLDAAPFVKAMQDSSRAAEKFKSSVGIESSRLDQIRRFREENQRASGSVQSLAEIQARAARDPIYARSMQRTTDVMNQLRPATTEAAAATQTMTAATQSGSTAFQFLGSGALKVAGILGLTLSAVEIFTAALHRMREAAHFIVEATADFQDFEARLIVTQGSVAGAAHAFELLEEFTTRLPFGIEDTTAAFIRLRLFGVTPTEEVLEGLGNVAVTFRRSFDELVNLAISGAAGIVRSLKRMGIAAKVEGNTIRLSFQGVTETVPRTVEGIVGFLVQVGKLPLIASAAERQVNTLRGQMTLLRNELTISAHEAGRAGLGAALVDLIRFLRESREHSDGLASSLGRLAGQGVTAFTNALRTLEPFLGRIVNLLDRLAGEVPAAQRAIATAAAAIRSQVGELEKPADLEVLRRSFVEQQALAGSALASARRQLEEARAPAARIRLRVQPLFDFLGSEKVFGAAGRLQLVTEAERQAQIAVKGAEAQFAVAQQGLEAVQARLEELTIPVPDFGTDLQNDLDKAKTKTDAFTKAMERLEQGRREIEFMAGTLAATGEEFDRNATLAQEVGQAIRSMAGLENLTDPQVRVLAQLRLEYIQLTAAVRQSKRDVDEWVAALRGAPTTPFPQLVLSSREAELARERFTAQVERTEALAASLASSFGTAFSSIIAGTNSVGEAFKRMAQTIIDEILRITVVRQLTNFLANLFAPIPGAPAEVARAPVGLIGRRQFGGPVSTGRAYLVGERGPELFVPGMAGMVTPGGRSGEVHYHTHNSYDIRTMDSRGVRQVLEQHAAAVHAVNRRQERLSGVRNR